MERDARGDQQLDAAYLEIENALDAYLEAFLKDKQERSAS